ncbi:stalk domain-containing protein [Paenibacillus spongiae]|uniref:DUF4352 domain-containing protein n=1 Tax=Paenibacillus spongiae TaxID=2909671 RepID=A0ABY5S187_9BACL|nr:stalk domain-containing protein [Paenibacillus spongiae]UVI27621.1 DUF4352 domain-containing protein [Paenibacillus spongiae]
MKKKVIWSSIIATFMLVLAAAGGYAAAKMTLIVDGKKASVDPVVIKGVTYVPLRAAGEMLGATVQYESSTNTVKVTSKGATAPTAPKTDIPSKETSSKIGYSRSTPAPIGSKVTFDADGLLDKYTAEIALEEVIRGSEAGNKVASANMFNDAAPEGYEYLLAKINVKVLSNKKADATVSISGLQFTLVSSDGKDYNSVIVVAPEPELRSNLYAGASHSGWAVFLVKTDDKSPLITFGRNFDGTGGIWLKP